ncbi:copper amine oxidase [Cyathus striatus]|nr:copper amine oxidase [Cyathus striatus]
MEHREYEASYTNSSLYKMMKLNKANGLTSPEDDPPPPIPLAPQQCPAPTALPAKPPVPSNPWAPLTPGETSKVHKWLFDPSQGLNLTHARDASMSDNTIFHIELYPPPKNVTIGYFSNPESKLERYARVSLNLGGLVEPLVKDYLVGPLDGEMGMRELREIYNALGERKGVPYNARADNMNLVVMQRWSGQQMVPYAEMCEDLFSASATGLPTDTLVAGPSGPWSYDGTFRRLWITWRLNKAGSYLLPVGLYMYIDIGGTDTNLWSVRKAVYGNTTYPSLAALHEAYLAHSLPAMSHPHPSNSSWPQRNRPSSSNANWDLDDRPGPRGVSFKGVRYKVDKENGYISWMGWSFFLGFERDMGLSLWDVRVRGERVLYQLQPQEALAQYSGSDPVQSSTAWLDRHFGMGLLTRDLIPNYDCPPESTFLPITTYFTETGGMIIRERGVCVFELDTGKPLSRHFGEEEGEFGAVKGWVLVVRAVSTAGNYDYRMYCSLSLASRLTLTLLLSSLVFDYIFHLDGTLEVRVSASGYLQGGYWTPEADAYGGRIRETSMGSVHDHVINFKVDLDIAGTKNSVMHTRTVREEVDVSWGSSPTSEIDPNLDPDLSDWGSTLIQQRIERTFLTDESESRLKHPLNFQGHYAVVNREERNKWGNVRGYVVLPGYSPIHNTIVGSKRMQDNANWAQYNLAFSKRKETEPSSSTSWNLHLPGAPVVDFDKFFNDEGIDGEDVVGWVNVGMHHLPHAEDSPNTKTNIATSSFLLTPLNFFDSDISMESMNAIILRTRLPARASTAQGYAVDVANANQEYIYDDYGVPQDHTCLPVPPPPFGYGGTMRVYDDEGKEIARV